jgi:hypothetical protein
MFETMANFYQMALAVQQVYFSSRCTSQWRAKETRDSLMRGPDRLVTTDK